MPQAGYIIQPLVFFTSAIYKKKLRKKYIEDAKVEKQELKKILNEEFGWFRNRDEGRKETGDEKGRGANRETQQVGVEWDDNKKTETKKNSGNNNTEIKKEELKKESKTKTIINKITKDKKEKKEETTDDYN